MCIAAVDAAAFAAALSGILQANECPGLNVLFVCHFADVAAAAPAFVFAAAAGADAAVAAVAFGCQAALQAPCCFG